jgi:hypothetical protein
MPAQPEQTQGSYALNYQHDGMDAPAGLERHVDGDWAIACARKYQRDALRHGNRLHHRYTVLETGTGVLLYDGAQEQAITEALQALADEYQAHAARACLLWRKAVYTQLLWCAQHDHPVAALRRKISITERILEKGYGDPIIYAKRLRLLQREMRRLTRLFARCCTLP